MRRSEGGTTAAAADGRPIRSGGGFFDNKPDELRSLCPRNAKVINVEPEQVGEKALADLERIQGRN